MAYRRGHCKGHKKEKPHASDWYQRHFEEHLARIEAAWAAKVEQVPPPPVEEEAAA